MTELHKQDERPGSWGIGRRQSSVAGYKQLFRYRLAGSPGATRWLAAVGLLLLLLLVPLLAYPGNRDLPPSILVQLTGLGLGDDGDAATWDGSVDLPPVGLEDGSPPDAIPPLEAVRIERSAHVCTEATTHVERVCNYKSLVLYNRKLFYVADDPKVKIPLVDVHYLHLSTKTRKDTAARFGVGNGLEVVAPGQLPWGDDDTVTARVLDNVYLWNARMGYNLGHAMGEELINMHNSMCKYLGSCTYSQRQRQHIVRLDQSRMLSSVRDTITRCLSRSPPHTLGEWSNLGGVKGIVVMRNVTVGVGPDCRAMGECRPWDPTDKRQKRMPPDMMESWRWRIGDCMGFDASAPASLRPLRVLVVDRKYGQSRHFSNIHAMERAIRAMLPEAEVRVAYLEDYPIQQQIQMVHNASIILMMHGAALGLWPLLPRNAVGIHGVMDLGEEGEKTHSWAERMANDLVLANITYVPLTNERGDLVRFYINRLKQIPGYKDLRPRKRLALLEDGKCPDSMQLACRKMFFLRMADLEVDIGLLRRVVKQAVMDLLSKYPPEDTAGLKWAA